jgi:hypothetical protein
MIKMTPTTRTTGFQKSKTRARPAVWMSTATFNLEIFMLMPNVRDQRRRAVGAPLAWERIWEPLAVPASGVTTSDDRCIA